METVLEQFGYQRPGWHVTCKDRVAGLTGDPETFAHAVTTARLLPARVDRIEVDVGLDRPEFAVEWRLNMPHTIGFVVGLDLPTRAARRARATAALSRGLPSSVVMLTLRAHVT